MSLSGLSAIALVAAGPVAAHAQGTVGAGMANAASSSGPIDAGEIIVTAQKREQTLQDVAGSISALSGNQLLQRGIRDVSEIARAVPGVNFVQTSGSTQITIRGVGLQVPTGLAEANVAQHVDGVFQSQPSLPGVDPVDLERVEVLRGPQGTLYGRNATGGTVNFITKKPTLDLHFGGSVGISSFRGRRIDGYLSGPLVGDEVLGRVSGYYERNRGYIYNSLLDEHIHGAKRYGFRGALRFLPSSDLTIDLSAYYQRDNQSIDAGAPLPRGPNPLLDAVTTPIGTIPRESVVLDRRPFRTSGSFVPEAPKWAWGTTLDMKLDASDNFAVRSVTGYLKHRYGPAFYDSDGASLGIVDIGSPADPRDQKSDAFSQEFNFSGEAMDNRLKWLAGLYYFSGSLDATIPVFFVDPAIQDLLGGGTGAVQLVNNRQAVTEQTTSYAVFGDVTYSLTPAVRLNLGGRLSWDKKDALQTNTSLLVIGGVPTQVDTCRNFRILNKYNQANGKARLEWDITDKILAYAQWQTGFKDGGANLSICFNEFAPEKITSYEAGVKTSLLDDKVTLNASVFHYKYKDLQILDFKSASETVIENIPRAASTGAEIELVARPVRDLQFNGSVSLLDAEIKEYSATDPENPGTGLRNLAGLPLPSSPRYTISAGVDYTIRTGMGRFLARAELFRSGNYNFRFFDNALDRKEAYTLVNLYLTYFDPSDRFQIRGYVKNVGDTVHLNSLLWAAPTGFIGDYAPPREWGVTAAFNF